MPGPLSGEDVSCEADHFADDSEAFALVERQGSLVRLTGRELDLGEARIPRRGNGRAQQLAANAAPLRGGGDRQLIHPHDRPVILLVLGGRNEADRLGAPPRDERAARQETLVREALGGGLRRHIEAVGEARERRVHDVCPRTIINAGACGQELDSVRRARRLGRHVGSAEYDRVALGREPDRPHDLDCRGCLEEERDELVDVVRQLGRYRTEKLLVAFLG